MSGEAETWLALVALLAAGGIVMGVLAGLFGVGGGAISTPILYEMFRVWGVPEDERMALAVGTSLAIIAPTSVRSTLAHHRRGAVDMALLRAWAPSILVGVIAGAVAAAFAEAWVFQIVFVAVSGFNAVKLLLGLRFRSVSQTMPGGPRLWAYGGVIGALSSLMGIGGGVLANLAMTLHGRTMLNAVATSAGVGALIAVPGALGYVAAGWGREGLPPDALGFVSPLGVAAFVPATILAAPLGVRLAHALPARVLEVAFGCFLVAASARFLALLVG